MPPTWIDTHAHLDDGRFDPDRPTVLARAQAAGVRCVVTIGVDLATSRAAVALAGRFAAVSAAVGLQPTTLTETAAEEFAGVEELAAHPRVVAIGETGLDSYWGKVPPELQREYFALHLALARRVGKPVVIHARSAEAAVADMVEAAAAAFGPVRGVMHSYTGDAPTAARCVAAGLHISFAGMVTYKSAADLRGVAAAVPLDRLLVETDAPYLAPVPHRGRRCEPGYVADTGAAVAAARGEGVEAVAAATTANAVRLFGLAAGWPCTGPAGFAS